jgi:hypothetical protein
MKKALLDLVTSKKFLAAVTAIAIYIAGRFGFDLDTTVLDRIYAALLVYVGAQGIADAGKAAAAIAAASAARPATVAASAAPPVAGGLTGVAGVAGVAGAAVLALAVIGGAALTACGPRTGAVGHAVWDCTAPERAELVSVLTPVLDSLIVAAASADGSKIDLAPIRAALTRANLESDAGVLLSCAVATAFAALEHPAKPASEALASVAARPALDPAALRSTFDQLRAADFPGATFKTASGTI